MSNTLRERIAAALDSIPADHRPSTLVNLDRAEAVIAALNLRIVGDDTYDPILLAGDYLRNGSGG